MAVYKDRTEVIDHSNGVVRILGVLSGDPNGWMHKSKLHVPARLAPATLDAQLSQMKKGGLIEGRADRCGKYRITRKGLLHFSKEMSTRF